MSSLAYIDPGTGLLVWQAVVAVFLGMLFYIKRIRTWVANLFRRLFGANKSPEPASVKLQPPTNDAGR